MKKRNLQPTQTAPVERDNTGSSKVEKGLSPSWEGMTFSNPMRPFAGDDAE